MPTICPHRNPLRRDGVNQTQRLPEALNPAYVQVDERDYDDLIRFALRYARYLRWYNSGNQADGDWLTFFRRDVSSVIAALAGLEMKRQFQFLQQLLEDLNTSADELTLKKTLKHLFDYAFGLCAYFDQEQRCLPAGLLLRDFLQNNILTHLQPRLRRLITYYKAAADQSMLDPSGRETPADPPLEWRYAQDVLGGGLSTLWTEGLDWVTFQNNSAPAPEIFGDNPNLIDRMQHAATYNLFTNALETLLEVLTSINKAAGKFLTQTLTDWPDHAPNNALYLVFLKLFRFAQNHLNQFTQRHLDFYYREVLHFSERPPVPARVHLLLGLARQVAQYRIEQDTSFRAGKDQLGRHAFFGLERELAANQAQVAEIKSVFFDPVSPYKLFAAPVTNSADGQGEAFTETPARWQAFRNTHIPDGKIGFALASHYLYLREGIRKIEIRVTFKGKHDITGLESNAFEAYLTTAKGWLQKKVTIKLNPGEGYTKLRFEIGLTAAEPSILPWQSAAHEDPFQVNLPIVKIRLRNEHRNFRTVYRQLRKLVIQDIGLLVTVDGIRDLAISTDQGPQDPSRSFFPFGALPKRGNSMIIGNKEIFQKKLTNLTLHLSWKGYPSGGQVLAFPLIPYYFPPVSGIGPVMVLEKSSSPPTISVSVLQSANITGNNIWQTISDKNKIELISIFDEESPDLRLFTRDIPVGQIDYSKNVYFSPEQKQGYIKLSLNGDFGHEVREKAYIVALIEMGKRGSIPAVENIPEEPYTPELASITAGYSASTGINLNSVADFDERKLRFYQMAPFGLAERHPFLASGSGISLLPLFAEAKDDTENEGELYIGLSGLRPPQNLSLLFQVVEGSTNPLKDKPDNHLRWSYLSHNFWLPFKPEEILDSTHELLRSGIISFAVPKTAGADNTWMPSGLHWIRVAVPKDSDLVCDMIGVHAQAGLAVFRDRGNDPAFSAVPLPSGSITKLESASAEIKTIEQPYPAFGGQGPETAPQFYTRISERLRHKNRSIAIWDYERMILENFPEIFKVKCVNHTLLEGTENNASYHYNEMAPGHVLIVPIANIRDHETADPLRPYTSLGLLEAIENFLIKHTSPFVKIHVRNPLFERIRLEFKVRFHTGLDKTLYEMELQKEIRRLLSPWAHAEGRDIAFGGIWYKSVLIDFIEERPYVDFVTDFELFQYFTDEETSRTKVKEAVASTARSVLTSYETHGIESIDEC